jgi:SNF2 family DNA or RNA helicase
MAYTVEPPSRLRGTSKQSKQSKSAPVVTKPFVHQAKSLKHNEKTEIVYDCSDPGTGKTYVRIMAFLARLKRMVSRVLASSSTSGPGSALLVLAPKSLLRSVWLNDIKKFAPTLRVAVSTAGKHEGIFSQDADVYVTNIDAVKWLAKQNKKFFERFSELVIDESTAYKHHSSQRSRAAAKISKFFQYRCCMTGTPNGRSITDIWHQIYLLDGGKRLGPSFFAFRNSVCEAKQVGRNEHAIQWTDKVGAEEAVFGLLSDIVIRHKFEDCVDIPANHTYPVPYELLPKHRKAYDEMMEKCMLEIHGTVEEQALARMRATTVAELKAKAKIAPKVVTAMHAGVLAQKLLQIASGAVYESPDKYHVLDYGRYEMILDLIEERQHSLCFFYWKHQRDMLCAEADKRGITFAVIDGSTKESERDDIVARYQRGMYQTLFAHPKSAAHGLTLTKGTTTIWPSPTYDLELFKQGSKRQHRMGQTKKTETIIVTAQDTVEEKVYKILSDKNARMDSLLDLFSTL